jgi:hypothetical protein
MSRPCIAALALLVGWCAAQESSREPAPIASTRWSLKETLEAHRSAKPRLAPPPATEEEKARGRSNAGQGGMRRLLDPELRAKWPRDWLDDNMPLTKLMRNELLWITSRVNNCLY